MAPPKSSLPSTTKITNSRQVFSLKDKLYIKEIASTLPKRNRYETVSAIFKKKYDRVLKRNTFFGIMRHQGLNESETQFSKYQLKSKRIGYPSKYPELEKLLQGWLQEKDNNGKTITVPLVVERAKGFYKEKLLKSDDSNKEMPKFSDYWCRTFLKRSGYQFMSTSGQRIWVRATTVNKNQTSVKNEDRTTFLNDLK